MRRRFPTSRRPALESLEGRRNPAALVPIAEFPIEPAPVGNGNLQIADLTSVAIYPNTSLNAFAGQTIRNQFDAADASTASRIAAGKTIYVGSANGGVWKSTDGSSPSMTPETAASSDGPAHLGPSLPNVPVVDVQLTQEQETLAAHELGHTLGFRHEHTRPTSDAAAVGGYFKESSFDIETAGVSAAEGTARHVRVSGRITAVVAEGSVDHQPIASDNHGTHVAGTIGAIGNNGVGVAGSTKSGSVYTVTFGGSLLGLESLIDDLARDVANATANRSSAPIKIFLCPSESRSSFPGFTGGVYVAAGDVHDGGIGDIISDADGDELASGYIRIKKLNSGG